MRSLDAILEHCTGTILFESLASRRAYGVATPERDIGVRGIFAVPASANLSPDPPPNQLSETRNYAALHSIQRIVELLAEINPNILVVLYIPKDCAPRSAREARLLTTGRALFVSKQFTETHIGYAISLIKVVRGQN